MASELCVVSEEKAAEQKRHDIKAGTLKIKPTWSFLN